MTSWLWEGATWEADHRRGCGEEGEGVGGSSQSRCKVGLGSPVPDQDEDILRHLYFYPAQGW